MVLSSGSSFGSLTVADGWAACPSVSCVHPATSLLPSVLALTGDVVHEVLCEWVAEKTLPRATGYTDNAPTRSTRT